jgi:hypothetical protein
VTPFIYVYDAFCNKSGDEKESKANEDHRHRTGRKT